MTRRRLEHLLTPSLLLDEARMTKSVEVARIARYIVAAAGRLRNA